MKSFVKYYLLLPTFIFFPTLFLSAKPDTLYIKSTGFKNDLRLTYGFNSQYIDLYSTMANKLGDHVYYAPNVNSNLRATLNFYFLSLSYGRQVSNKLMSPEKFGTTEYNDFGLSIFRNYIGFEFYYKKYNGLYRPAIDLSVAVRPDAALTSAGMNLYIIGGGKKFSYRSAFNQTAIQSKSAGTLIILLSNSYRQFEGNYSLLPSALDSTRFFAQFKGLESANYILSTLSPGYARNFSIKGGKWYVCPMITSGLGIANYKISADTGNFRTWGLHWDVRFRIAAGLNMNRFFYSIYFDSESNNNFLTEKIVMNNTLVSVLFTAGCRFGKKKK